MVASHVESYLSQMDLKDQGFDIDSYASSILDAKCKRVDTDEVVCANCAHLKECQQEELKPLLTRHSQTFYKILGEQPGGTCASWAQIGSSTSLSKTLTSAPSAFGKF